MGEVGNIQYYLDQSNPLLLHRKIICITRKSSCMNARGILTTAYQVLHLLPKVGYPPAGVHPGQVWWGGYLRWGTPLRGVPPSQFWQVGTQGGVTPLGQVWWGGTPLGQVWQGGTWGGVTPPAGPGWGTPPIWTWLGYPPRCEQTRQTRVKT